jgi:hypothetical protein
VNAAVARHARALAMALLGTLTLGGARAARADEAAVAEQLYELGRKLMAEGRVSEACPKFEESQRLDPATGTLLNLATCHEAEGKLATAWGEFKEGELAARHDGRVDREDYARLHLAGLEPRLSYLTVSVSKASLAPDLVVTLDGKPLGPGSWDTAVPVDPGEHEVVARAEGYAPFSGRVTVTYLARRHAIAVELAPGKAAPRVSVVAPPPPTPAAPESRPARDGGRIAGYVVGGVAVAALGAGAIFAVRANQKWDARNANGQCDATNACNSVGVAYGNDAQTAATLADVSFVVGALGAAAASYLLFFRSDAASGTTTAQLRLGAAASASAAGLTLSGAW